MTLRRAVIVTALAAVLTVAAYVAGFLAACGEFDREDRRWAVSL